MEINLKYHRVTSWVLAACSLYGLGCGSAPDSGGGSEHDPQSTAGHEVNVVNEAHGAASGMAAAAKQISPAPLYRKELGPDHIIELYDVGIREVFSLDNGESAFIDTSKPIAPLSDIYRKLNPGVTEIPPAIAEVDRHAEEVQEIAKYQGRPISTYSPTGASSTGSSHKHPLTSAAALTCSGDNFDDNWSATWFLQNNCPAELAPPSNCVPPDPGEGPRCPWHWCKTNVGFGNSGDIYWADVHWTQMEGDFNLPGHITITRKPHVCPPWWQFWASCSWGSPVTWTDHDIAPRHIENWIIPARSEDIFNVASTSQCGHLDFAFAPNN
jgi:hypothetical protein